jgi:hypothetical protein
MLFAFLAPFFCAAQRAGTVVFLMGAGVVASCQRLPAPPAEATPRDCQALLSRADVLQQLRNKRVYAGYARSHLWFQPSLTQHCEGLYFVVLPSRNTNFNARVPCLVTRQHVLLNTSAFMGEAGADTLGNAGALHQQMQRLSGAFNSMELDSMRQAFRFGGEVSPKAGHYLR